MNASVHYWSNVTPGGTGLDLEVCIFPIAVETKL